MYCDCSKTYFVNIPSDICSLVLFDKFRCAPVNEGKFVSQLLHTPIYLHSEIVQLGDSNLTGVEEKADKEVEFGGVFEFIILEIHSGKDSQRSPIGIGHPLEHFVLSVPLLEDVSWPSRTKRCWNIRSCFCYELTNLFQVEQK